MLLEIQVQAKDIVKFDPKEGVLVVRVHHYGTYASGAHLVTMQGTSAEEHTSLRNNPKQKGFLRGNRSLLVRSSTGSLVLE